MTHKCIDEMNELLKEHNAVLATAIDFSGKNRELVAIGVDKINSSKKTKIPALFATHCPFCGTALKGMK